MEKLGTIIGLCLSVAMFFVGRYWSKSDKNNQRIDELEQKNLDTIKGELGKMEVRIGERLNKIEQKLDDHVTNTDNAFKGSGDDQKKLDDKIRKLENENVGIKKDIDANNKLFEEKLNRLDEVIVELKKLIGSITITTTRRKQA